jgi:elongation factor 1-gamma
MKLDYQMHDINLGRQARALKFLDEHLAASTAGYLISDAMTLADIAIAAVSQQAGKITCGAAERAQYPNVFAHYEKVAAHQGEDCLNNTSSGSVESRHEFECL